MSVASSNESDKKAHLRLIFSGVSLLHHCKDSEITIICAVKEARVLVLPTQLLKGEVSCMKKLWPENFMHENFIFMHENDIFMHENENVAQFFSWVKIPCMKLCTAQLPMKIPGAKKICQGRNLYFHAMHGNIIFMHEIFMPRFVHA